METERPIDPEGTVVQGEPVDAMSGRTVELGRVSVIVVPVMEVEPTT